MTTWKFRSCRGDTIEVRAEREDAARDRAMRALWGPPTGIYSAPYRGTGLALVEAGR